MKKIPIISDSITDIPIAEITIDDKSMLNMAVIMKDTGSHIDLMPIMRMEDGVAKILAFSFVYSPHYNGNVEGIV